MTLQELSAILSRLEADNFASVPYEVFGEIFPPGIEDARAKEAAYHLSNAHGCLIENRPHDGAVWFVKHA